MTYGGDSWNDGDGVEFDGGVVLRIYMYVSFAGGVV